MTSEVWQRVGPLSPCGTPSYPSNGLPGSADVHKHAQTIRSLGRWFLSLAEERKVKLACIRKMAGVPEDCLFFFVCCHWSKGLPRRPLTGFDPSPLTQLQKNWPKWPPSCFICAWVLSSFPPCDNESKVPLDVCSFYFHQFCCILIRYTKSSWHQELRPSSSGLNSSFSRFVFEVSAHYPPGSPNPEAHLTFSLDSSTPPNCYWTYGLLARVSSCSAAAHRFDICMIKPVFAVLNPHWTKAHLPEQGQEKAGESRAFCPPSLSRGVTDDSGVRLWSWVLIFFSSEDRAAMQQNGKKGRKKIKRFKPLETSRAPGMRLNNRGDT